MSDGKNLRIKLNITWKNILLACLQITSIKVKGILAIFRPILKVDDN